MGAEVAMNADPIFQVRAVGSFEQEPGCPDYTLQALSPERLEHLCKSECYNPSDERRLITRIEIVRIRPQQTPGEEVGRLIDDPWRTFECDPDPAGCSFTFTDPDYDAEARDTLYYVRAFEAPTLAINGANLRCEYDEQGQCVNVNPCPNPDDPTEDCLAPIEPRAWSSPIWLDWQALSQRGRS
jgi:hypothetical protein